MVDYKELEVKENENDVLLKDVITLTLIQ